MFCFFPSADPSLISGHRRETAIPHLTLGFGVSVFSLIVDSGPAVTVASVLLLID